MFTKSAEGDSMPAVRTGAASGARSVLSSDLRIVGNISTTGVVEILGNVQGDIDARTLVIGAEGTVTGKVSAETVEVRGALSGSASCVQFTLRSTAVASVQVTYETLVIENGAQIDGKFKHAAAK